MKSFSIKEALRFGWTTFKKEPWLFVGVAAFVFVITALTNTLSEEGDFMGALITIPVILLQWWLYLGVVRVALAAHAGAPVSFKMVFGESWKTLFRFALAMIVTGVLTLIGFVLLIIPGIIVQLMLSMVVFAVLDKGMEPIAALKESKRLTDGHKWDLFLLMLVLVVLNVLGAIVFGVGLLVTVPVSILAITYVYKKLDRKDDIVAASPIAMQPPVANA